MKEYFSRLNPSERRFVVVVALLFFIVVNLFWVWPHFSDWGALKGRLDGAYLKLANYQAAIQQSDRLKPELAKLESDGMTVPPEDQSIEFMRTIQSQAGQSGVGITGYGRQTSRTNDLFFTEQDQTISGVATEKQLVAFLFDLGSGNSLVRVRSLSVHPDQNRQQLNANITLVASYQRQPKTGAGAPARKAPTPPTTAPSPTAQPPATGPPAKVVPQPNPASLNPLRPKKP